MITREQILKFLDDNLIAVEKPARYIGGEINSVTKPLPFDGLHFALVFPEPYELGMSHLGGRLLYHHINRKPDLFCERVFFPRTDMLSLMHKKEIPVFSLETKTPLHRFDVIGFSLEYELSFPNILEILSLSKIPMRARDRGEDYPLVIAGGVACFNPEPVAEVFDLIWVGEADDTIVPLLTFIKENKNLAKKELLKLILRRFPDGVYIPSFYDVIYTKDGYVEKITAKEEAPLPVRSHYVPDLNELEYPTNFVVPWVETVHDKLNIEVMRGCPRGCRFCSAGFVYRPMREREPKSVVSDIKRGIKATGQDAVSLLSLSTTDYSGLEAVFKKIRPFTEEHTVSIALPSIRTDALSETIIDALRSVRKSSLTFAPEAGTERLRRVINKEQDIEQFFSLALTAFREGWKFIKLYFMVGLPTETDEDIDGIIDMINSLARMASRFGARIKPSIGQFIPKPQTPFQWTQLTPTERIKEIFSRIQGKIRGKNVELELKNPQISLLEAILSRGDRRMFKVVESAWRNGAVFSGWSDMFDFSSWEEAFKDAGIDYNICTAEKDIEKTLPWEHIYKGCKREYLLSEYKKALAGETTPDCRARGCDRCPFCEFEQMITVQSKEEVAQETGYGKTNRHIRATRMLRTGARIVYQKRWKLRWLSHLDLMRLFDRAIRRADIPVAVTEGFHKRQKIAYSPPLPLGYTGDREYLDIFFDKPVSELQVKKLGHQLPDGIHILEIKPIMGNAPSLSKLLDTAVYSFHIPKELIPDITERIKEWLSREVLIVARRGKNIDIRRFIDDVAIKEENERYSVVMVVRNTANGSTRPDEFLRGVGVPREIIRKIHFHRDGLFLLRGDALLDANGNTWKTIDEIKNQSS